MAEFSHIQIVRKGTVIAYDELVEMTEAEVAYMLRRLRAKKKRAPRLPMGAEAVMRKKKKKRGC